jgi:alpha-mannosidase
MEASIQKALYNLQKAADAIDEIFPEQKWLKISGSGPEIIEQVGNGVFLGVVWEPGENLILRCRLTIPEEVGGVSLVGDALEASVFSLYPVSLRWNDQPPLFDEEGVPVASGPILATVIPQLRAGENGALTLQVKVPNHQTTQWFRMPFTTPRLRQRFELFDTAWGELLLAEALAVTEEEQAAVLLAASQVPDELSRFDARGLQQMEDSLAVLSPKVKELFVHVIGHSHIDMNWLWTWPDTVNVILRDFKSVLALMDDYPELTFTHSQPATYEVVRNQAPDLFARMLNRIREGRWEPATMTWVEGDENMAAGEALARHFLEGVTYSREVLGFEPSSFLAPDTFGHPGNLPQLGISAGAKRYYHHRCNPGGFEPWPAYWWEGQDGTRLLAISTPTYNGDIRARDLAEAALWAHKYGQTHSLHFHGIGDHGGGPARHNLDALRQFQQRSLLPSAQCSTLELYTKKLLETGVSLPVHRGESSTIFEGCYSTHADIKRYNRSGENLLSTAEALSVMAGIDARKVLEPAWRAVLFNQFHDILDGSAIHESYEKSAKDYAEVYTAAEGITKEALQILAGGFEPGTIAVTNPLGWERTGWVCVPGQPGKGSITLVSDVGHQTVGQYTPQGLGFVARVPGFGTVSYQKGEAQTGEPGLRVASAFSPGAGKEAEPQGTELTTPYYQIDTPFFRVYMRRDSGILTSFYDKRVRRELVGFGMRHSSDYFDTARPDLALNVLQLLEERSHPMSAWHMDEVQTEFSLIQGAAIAILENGPARIVIEALHTLRSSQISQQIIFYRDLPQVDFFTRLNWQEPGGWETGVPNLKIAFTAALPEANAWFETPFAAVQRPGDGREVPALRWADVGGSGYGMALLNDSKYGFDVLGSRLRMTLVRSAFEPDQIADLGQHEIHYCLVPHPGDWRAAGVVRLAAGFNQPLIALPGTQGQAAERSHAAWRPEIKGSPSILLAGLKSPRNGSGRILRLYESAGCSGEVEIWGLPVGATAWETNLVEDKLHTLPVSEGCLRLAFHPWQVRTAWVEA